MIIQLNADKNLAIHEAAGDAIKKLLIDELNRYSKHISRLDIHIADENGIKQGFNDIQCMIEAHRERTAPVVVTNVADTVDQSVNGAIEKMKHALASMIRGKRKRITSID